MKKIIFFSIIYACAAQLSFSQQLSKDERMQWWREARFGMFIHWGGYAQFAGVYNSHEQLKGGAEWIMNRSKIPVAEYQAMAKQFNPIKFDADEWVKWANSYFDVLAMFNSVGSFSGMIPGIVILRMFYFTLTYYVKRT